MFQVMNDQGFTTQYLVTGSGWTTAGIFQPNMAYFGADATLSGGFVLGHAGPYPVKLMYNGAIKATLQNGLSVGGATDPGAGAVGVQHLVGAVGHAVGFDRKRRGKLQRERDGPGFYRELHDRQCTGGGAVGDGELRGCVWRGGLGLRHRVAGNAASAAAASSLYATTTTTGLTLSTGSALPASTSFAWNFVLVQ